MAAFRTKTGSGLYKPFLIYEPAQIRKCLGAGKKCAATCARGFRGRLRRKNVMCGLTGRE